MEFVKLTACAIYPLVYGATNNLLNKHKNRFYRRVNTLTKHSAFVYDGLACFGAQYFIQRHIIAITEKNFFLFFNLINFIFPGKISHVSFPF